VVVGSFELGTLNIDVERKKGKKRRGSAARKLK
jgi:hypothetical protein